MARLKTPYKIQQRNTTIEYVFSNSLVDSHNKYPVHFHYLNIKIRPFCRNRPVTVEKLWKFELFIVVIQYFYYVQRH